MTYRPGLDGLRGVAILLVLVCHLGVAPTTRGWLGVDVFFVLSGYLITSLLLDEHHREGRIRLARFYARRIVRLYPAVLVMLAVVAPIAVASGLARAYGMDVAHSVFGAASYTANYNSGPMDGFNEPFRHMWSLAVEEQFYVVWPLALMLLLRFGRRATVLAAVGACLMSWEWMIVHRVLWTGLWGYRTEVRGGGLLLGCALAVIAPRVPRWTGWLGVFLLFVVLGGDTLVMTGLNSTFYVPVATIAAAALIAAPPGFLSWSPLCVLGRLSYSIYLWHYPAISLARGEGLFVRTLWVGAACAAAAVSYLVVERPVRRIAYARIDALADWRARNRKQPDLSRAPVALASVAAE